MNNQNCINHVVFVLDSSGSMSHLQNAVIKVFDRQIQSLAQQSKDLNQETRVSVYRFGSVVRNLIFDKDVLRLPSIAQDYAADEPQTALIDGTLKAIEDLEKTCTLYGDHSFLIIVQSDGGNNVNNHLSGKLAQKLASLPENYTVACLVPDAVCLATAKKFGFSSGNLSIWNTTSQGLDEVGNKLTEVTKSYMTGRARGVRGNKNLFQVDTSNLTANAVKQTLDELKPSEFELLHVRQESVIRPFVESYMKGYTQGSAYYQLVKSETVQGNKNILIRSTKNGKVYSGDNARRIVGLPTGEIKVKPGAYGEYEIYVQSTSVNRKLPAGTQLIVLK